MSKSAIKMFLNKFDYFGVYFNFNYKGREKYSSATGGFFFLLFILVGMTYTAIMAIPLFKRENMSIIHYTMQTFETDVINMKSYSINFAVGVTTCIALENINDFWKYFELKIGHVTVTKEDGELKKVKTDMEIGLCEYDDFYSKMNSSFDFIGLSSFYCPKNNNYTIQGTYNEPIFQYYEVDLLGKTNKSENIDKIKEILSSECNLNLYYVDVGFDLYNYTSPSRSFLSTQFVSLKFSDVRKMNFFYYLQVFDTYDNYVFDNYKRSQYVGFSSFDSYSIDKSEERFTKKTDDYNVFAKAYLRAALKRNIIQRKYMKITEFAASISSLLSAILIALFCLITFINKFFAEEAVMRKIFLFRNLEKGKQQNMKSQIQNLVAKDFGDESNVMKKSKSYS